MKPPLVRDSDWQSFAIWPSFTRGRSPWTTRRWAVCARASGCPPKRTVPSRHTRSAPEKPSRCPVVLAAQGYPLETSESPADSKTTQWVTVRDPPGRAPVGVPAGRAAACSGANSGTEK